MPELPEVESARQLAEQVCVGRTITGVIASEDAKVFCQATAEEVQAALLGKKVTGVIRKGKYFWFELGSGPALLVHFGMAGHLKVKDVKSARYVRLKDDTAWPPRFVKLQLSLDDGSQIAISDGRRFARMRIQADPRTDKPICKLGPDTFLELPDAAGFAELMAKHKRAVKAVLLDQNVLSGIGNWVADECCYMSRLFPEQPCCELTAAEAAGVHAAIQNVLAVAVEAGAEAGDFPKDWLFHYRWTGKKAGVDHFGNAVKFITVGGRTTAYVPALQKLPPGRTNSVEKVKVDKKLPEKPGKKPVAKKGKRVAASEKAGPAEAVTVDVVAAGAVLAEGAGATVSESAGEQKPQEAARKRKAVAQERPQSQRTQPKRGKQVA